MDLPLSCFDQQKLGIFKVVKVFQSIPKEKIKGLLQVLFVKHQPVTVIRPD